MAWVTLIGAGISAYSASQAGKDDGRESAGMRRIAEGNERRSNELYGEYRNVYQPRERQLLNTVFDQSRTPAAEAARAGAEARRAIDNTWSVSLRDAKRRGVNPSSPAYEALNRKQNAANAGLIAAAKTGGRRYAQERNLTDQLNVVSLGRGLPATAGNYSSSAAGLYGGLNELSMARDEAQGRLYGQAAGQVVSGLQDLRRPRQTSTGVSDRTNVDLGEY